MKKYFIAAIIILSTTCGFAQIHKLTPGENYTNIGNDTLYILPMKQVKSLLSDAQSNDICQEKLTLYTQQLDLKNQRIELADSAMHIKRLEAEFWHNKLLQNDEKLETQRLENLKLIDDRNRIRQSRVYYLVAGFVAGAVVISL